MPLNRPFTVVTIMWRAAISRSECAGSICQTVLVALRDSLPVAMVSFSFVARLPTDSAQAAPIDSQQSARPGSGEIATDFTVASEAIVTIWFATAIVKLRRLG